jgi:hypothetical protein
MKFSINISAPEIPIINPLSLPPETTDKKIIVKFDWSCHGGSIAILASRSFSCG